MKRSILLFALLSMLVVAPSFAAEPASTLDAAPAPVEAVDLEADGLVVDETLAEWADAPAYTPMEAAFGAGTHLGTVTCLCVCAAYIWSIGDVETTGTCEELVGQTCYNNWGQGTYTSCRQDGGGLPFP